jgi:pimeloyl-ACP methyl ester carboxylesterase
MVKAVLKEIGGSGSPLLMIHGFGSDSLSWSALVAGLSNQHRLLAVAVSPLWLTRWVFVFKK